MQLMFLNTKSQLIKRVLELEKDNKEIRGTANFIKRQHDLKSIQLTYKNDTIKALEDKLKQSDKKLAREIFFSELRFQARLQDKDDEIKHLQQQLEHEQDASNGYKKDYNELKEKETKEVNFTINQINTDVWKMIKGKTLPEIHKCTKECFVKHVVPAIQRDYDSVNPKYKEDNDYISRFLAHWNDRLNDAYDFVHYLYLNFDREVKTVFKI